MTSKWRVIKKAVSEFYDYIGIEFNMKNLSMRGVRLSADETIVRMETTPQFEVCENGKWETISHKEAPGMIWEMNQLRKEKGMGEFTEEMVLELLYAIENLKNAK